MKACIYEDFGGAINLSEVNDPSPTPLGVVLEVGASGICRSDWHGWMGHDPDIRLPHVPGHELAGTIVEVGKNVKEFKIGQRVTLPFVCGCGHCPQCSSGNPQVCDNQFQPGFTHWGSFAEYVAIDYADTNLVGLPDSVEFDTAASLGCRFGTAWRALIDQGALQAEQWVAIHGCGGVGLSAIMIAHVFKAKIIAIDINDAALTMAAQFGATLTINSHDMEDVSSIIREASNGGVHVSLDALGSAETCINAISSLRKRGRHIQVGLMTGEKSRISLPMGQVIASELKIIGSHGIQASEYSHILKLIKSEDLHPEQLITRKVSLDKASDIIAAMNDFSWPGITIINKFR